MARTDTGRSRDWASIRTGATFEGLVRTLVFFEDSRAALFGRPGPDGGQDVRSGDGKLVYQSKHHTNSNFAEAIADAKEEVRKIAKYRVPGHPRHAQWVGVQAWRLVTNLESNPTDEQRWATEVVPLFQALGLTASLWSRSNLDALLDRHPEVDRSYFGGQTRALLTLPEARERLREEQPFLRRSFDLPLHGRDTELQAIGSFLDSDKQFLLLSGPGGVGKTRLILEAAATAGETGKWVSYWANIVSMEGGQWFEGVTPERATLLIVDEPEDARVLEMLVEQMSGRFNRGNQWKVAVAVRSPKDPVLGFLTGPKLRHRVHSLDLHPLDKTPAHAMCLGLIDTGRLSRQSQEWKERAARILSSRFDRFPVWLTLAVQLLEQRGNLDNLPEDAEGLADAYLEEVVELQDKIPRQALRKVLQAVSLLGTLNTDEERMLGFVADHSGLDGDQAQRCLFGLYDRRVLSRRGARERLFELKPDVLRDRVLETWLVLDGEPSTAAKSLVAAIVEGVSAGGGGPMDGPILVSLARTEWLLSQGQASPGLMGVFFNRLMAAIPAMKASSRLRAADLVTRVASVAPAATAALSECQRQIVCEPESVPSLFGPRGVTHDDVVLEQAWMVFHAAMGARTADEQQVVLDEMCALVEAESAIGSRSPAALRNDGKRAKDLLVRTLEGGPDFVEEFDSVAREAALGLIRRLKDNPLDTHKRAVVQAIVASALQVSRQQSWSEGHQVNIRWLFKPVTGARQDVRQKVWETLRLSDVPEESRRLFWHVLADAHRTLLDPGGRGPGLHLEQYTKEAKEDLELAREVLASRTASVRELEAARALWEWHARYDKDHERRSMALHLEEIYRQNPINREFVPLLGDELSEDKRTLGGVKASELLSDTNPSAIRNFVARAVDYLKSAEGVQQLWHVAWGLGERAESADNVQSFVRDALHRTDQGPEIVFAWMTAGRWVDSVREARGGAAAASVVASLLQECGTPLGRANLVLWVFPRPGQPWHPSPEEWTLLRGELATFQAAEVVPAYLRLIGGRLLPDNAAWRSLVEESLARARPDQLLVALDALVQAAAQAVHDAAALQEPVPQDLGDWLFRQIACLPDMTGLLDRGEWHINHILGASRRPTLDWFANEVERRAIEDDSGETVPRGRLLLSAHRLSRFIEPLDPQEPDDSPSRRALDRLIAMLRAGGTVAYVAPEWLHDIDPMGNLVPARVAHEIASAAAGQPEVVARLARVGGMYEGSEIPWRTIARPALAVARALTGRERASIFHALEDNRPRTWTGVPGEVPGHIVAAVEHARTRLESELEEDFMPFWRWKLEIASAELKAAEDEAKEEREE